MNGMLQRISLVAAVAVVLAATTSTVHAQTYTVLYNFGLVSCDPEFPSNVGAVAQGRDGDFYSTTPGGGCNVNGAAFKTSPGRRNDSAAQL